MRDAEQLGAQRPAVLGGLADDQVRWPTLGDGGHIRGHRTRRRTGEHRRSGPRVSGRARRDPRRVGERLPHLAGRPIEAGGEGTQAERLDGAMERGRGGHRHVVAPVGQPSGDGDQWVQVTGARLGREQDPQHALHFTSARPGALGELVTIGGRCAAALTSFRLR